MRETPLALLFCGSGALACAAGLWLDDWFVLAGAFGAAAAGAWWWTEPGPTPREGVTSQRSDVRRSP